MLVLNEYRALIFVPEYVVVVRFVVLLAHDERGIHPLSFESINALCTILVLPDMYANGGGETNTCAGHRCICGIADSRHFFHEFIRDLVCESHAKHAVFMIDIAVHACILETDKGVDRRIADSQNVVRHGKSVARRMLHRGIFCV